MNYLQLKNMFEALIKLLADFITSVISILGYPGIALMMAIESANIPLPSEIIMPFSGYLVSQGRFTLLGIALAGGIGCLLGSWLSYAIGYFGGETLVRKLIKKYGKYVLVFEYELDEAIHFFNKYDQQIIFTSRLLPVIRTFISLPAGIAKMNFKVFTIYSLIGSIIWSYFLGYLGFVLGKNWQTLGTYFHKFDAALVILGLVTVIWYVQHKLKKHKRYLSRRRK